MNGCIAMISAIVLIINGSSIETAQKDFSGLGFTTTVIAGGSLMISGKKSLFTKRFHTELDIDSYGGVSIRSENASTRILPINSLPDTVQKYVIAIEFEEPISFGPTDY